MPWKRMLAYVTGEIEESLLLRIEYLLEENRVLRNQLQKRILLTGPGRFWIIKCWWRFINLSDGPLTEVMDLGETVDGGRNSCHPCFQLQR